MGIYLNPGNVDFQRVLNSEIYIDKSQLIEYTNKKLFTEQQFICVSRPRRFGKSMAANMLTAYYSCGCDSKEMFSNLKIAKSNFFEKGLNKYHVIRLDIQKFANRTETVNDMLTLLQKRVINELKRSFDINDEEIDLPYILEKIFDEYSQPFIFIIDEWDCILRDNKNNSESQKIYLNFLCDLFKGQSYVALAYMTGILPIKKYGKHSAINMFTEISMTNPRELAEFTGFTESEVKVLCEEYGMPFDETKRWHDGYYLKGMSIYNPRSVVMSMTGHDYDNYWTSTETYEALKVYIEMNFNGLKDKVTQLIDKAHRVNTSILKYNDENSLSCVISLAYYSARKTYTIERELPAGKGFADLILKPRKNNSNPAMIVELKYDKSAEGALKQIKKKQYTDCLMDYSGKIILVGINYDKDDKKHTCWIEKITK